MTTLEQSEQIENGLEQMNPAWQRLENLLPMADLSIDPEHPAPVWVPTEQDPFETLASILFRSQRCHPLIVGLPGTGKTHLINEFARQIREGKFGSLSGTRVIWIDCRHIGPEDSRACLEMIFGALLTESRVLLCLDGMATLLRRAGGGTNRPLLGSLLNRPGLRVLGTMTPWDYADLVAADAELARLFSPVSWEEVSEETAVEIAVSCAGRLAEQFNIDIRRDVVGRTVQLTSHFLVSEQHPAKDVNTLREAAERLLFQRDEETDPQALSLDDIAQVLAERTRIPVETLLGVESEQDFEAMLSKAIAGQSHAVCVAARELRRIKAGLTTSGKPATVMLFAGLTGVGKTELAKRIAEVYSSSRRLQVYSMGNFTEPHSVSGLIGVPPGYVGHEQGGRLINDLNADPYSVFLLDEAEKCHPNIWKPFLNLFDEGWIVDQRGIKAYADRAIFILTTNAGDRHISQLTEAGKSEAEVEEAVRQTLSRIRLERSTQPVFPPQFLARIQRIVVFRPLDVAAMTAIAEQACQRLVTLWKTKRQINLEITSDVITALGLLGHQLNTSSHNQEGGRVIQKLVDELLQDRLPGTISRDDAQSSANRVCMDLDLSWKDGPSAREDLRELLKITVQEV